MKYTDLEDLFRKEADKPEERSIYLPRVVPELPVDYVFVGMEPSLGSWVKTSGKTERQKRKAAESEIAKGFKDFAFSMGDFILHYCIRQYLCYSGANYYLTNISKGAMTTKRAAEGRQERYGRWYPLFEYELKLASKENTKVIALGKLVKEFLDKNQRQNIYHILHYSQQAARYRGRHIKGREFQFDEFEKTVSKSKVLDIAESVICECGMSKELRHSTIDRLQKSGDDLSLSQKKLMFDYKIDFSLL